MATSRGLRAACVEVLVALLALGIPLLAAPAARADSETIGGAALASRGIVVGRGLPKLPASVAGGWLIADLDTGDVLAARNPHGSFAPASTLKTLTALTLLPRLDPHRQVTPSFADVNVDGSRVGLVEHVHYPVDQLFAAMLIVSGNDAANTLATANGGVSKTVTDMNGVARHLQAYDTRAINPNGLDAAGQRTSAYDLALIARAAMALPAFRHHVATKHSKIRGPHGTIAISNHDKLLYNYPGAIGIKNGYTVKARASFVGAAKRGGHTLVVCLLHTEPRYWPEAAALLDWGFAAERAGATPVGQLVGPAQASSATVGSGDQALRPAATSLEVSHSPGAGLPVLPASVLVGLVALTVVVVRRRFT